MRLTTKSLISKIESLSSQMTPEQLKDFLDVLDSMAIMVQNAKDISSNSERETIQALKIAMH